MNDARRLFVGVRISVATANALAGAAETLARRTKDAGIDVRWVAPVNYHVTLKFLGSTREAVIGAVCDALERATEQTQRMTLRCARLGAFPTLEKARVLWAGIEDRDRVLGELARRIEVGCAQLGFVEPRPFHAHVTLGRARETRPLREAVLPLAEQMFGDTRVEAITLFESVTKSSGSVYKELHRIAFKTARIEASEGSERQTPAVQLDARHDRQSSTGTDLQTDTDDGWPRGHDPNIG